MSRVQWIAQKLDDDKYCIWGAHIPPKEAGMGNFIGPDGGAGNQGYSQKEVIDRLMELGVSEVGACSLVDSANCKVTYR